VIFFFIEDVIIWKERADAQGHQPKREIFYKPIKAICTSVRDECYNLQMDGCKATYRTQTHVLERERERERETRCSVYKNDSH